MGTEVAEPEDALAVAEHRATHARRRPLRQQLRDAPRVRVCGKVEAGGARQQAAPCQAGVADGRRVDDRQQSGEVRLKKCEERGAVGLHQRGKR
eukprot:334063-Chlamydomonas_euryale.AAC.1